MDTLCEFEKKQVDQDLHCLHKTKRKICLVSGCNSKIFRVGR